MSFLHKFYLSLVATSTLASAANALDLTLSGYSIQNTHTHTPISEPAPSFAQLDKAYKLAGVCFLGHGDCGGAGGGEYDSFGESLDVPGSYLCQNAGYKTCASGQIGNPATVCPDDENYFKECKCNYAEMTPGTYNNNCGPLATVSTCKDTTGDYYLCSCASDSMTKCNQSNELLLDKSQYCQNPKEGTRWYGKGACLVCTAPKVPNSSTKTCSCPTNYKVCTSPSVGVGTGCEDNGVMKYASCECPADYVTCTWGPAAGSASCNTGSGIRYKSCKPDPKTCDEWIQYKYGTPRDVVMNGSWGEDITIFKDTYLSTAGLYHGSIENVNYESAPAGLCNGRTNPKLTIDKLTSFYPTKCWFADIYVKKGTFTGYSLVSRDISFFCDITFDNIDSTDSVNYQISTGASLTVTDTLKVHDGAWIGGNVNINNMIVNMIDGSVYLGTQWGLGTNLIKNLTINGGGLCSIDRTNFELGTLRANISPSLSFRFRTTYSDAKITGDGIFINAESSAEKITGTVEIDGGSLEMNNKPLEINVPGSIEVRGDLKHPSKIVITKGDLIVQGSNCITLGGQICCGKSSYYDTVKKTFSTRTEITSASQLSDFLTCIPE